MHARTTSRPLARPPWALTIALVSALLLAFMAVGHARAATAVTTPGAVTVSADTAANGPAAAFTTLTTQPVLTLGDALGVGQTAVLTAPTGWSFSGAGSATGGGGTCVLGGAVYTATTISQNVTGACVATNTLTYSGVAVRPNAGGTTTTGNLSFSSSVVAANNANVGTLTITVGAPNRYTVTSNNYNPAANQTVTITAQLTDFFGTALNTAGQTVTWSSTGVGGSFLSPTSVTDANGRAAVGFTVSSIGGTIHTVTGTDTFARTGTTSAITVGALGYRYNVTASNYNPAPGTSVVIYAQLVDLNGFPVAAAGRLVTWTESTVFVLGAFFPGVSTTNGNGLAVTTYTTPYTSTFTRYITAADNFGITGTSALISTIGPLPSAVLSTITAFPTIVNANGIDYSTITVTLYNTFGLPLPGKVVQLNRTSGFAVVSSATGITNFAGVVVFTASNTISQTVTFSAIDVTDGISLSQTVTVTFIGAVPTATPTNTPTPQPTLPPAPQGTPGVTSLIAGAPAGSNSLAVSHSVGFVAGDVVRINAGASNQEDALLIATGPLTLATRLQFNHAPGEVVTRLFYQGLPPIQPPPPPIRPPAPQAPNAGSGIVGQVGGWPIVLVALLALTGAGIFSATAGGLGRRSVAVSTGRGEPEATRCAPTAHPVLNAVGSVIRLAIRRKK